MIRHGTGCPAGATNPKTGLHRYNVGQYRFAARRSLGRLHNARIQPFSFLRPGRGASHLHAALSTRDGPVKHGEAKNHEIRLSSDTPVTGCSNTSSAPWEQARPFVLTCRPAFLLDTRSPFSRQRKRAAPESHRIFAPVGRRNFTIRQTHMHLATRPRLSAARAIRYLRRRSKQTEEWWPRAPKSHEAAPFFSASAKQDSPPSMDMQLGTSWRPALDNATSGSSPTHRRARGLSIRSRKVHVYERFQVHMAGGRIRVNADCTSRTFKNFGYRPRKHLLPAVSRGG